MCVCVCVCVCLCVCVCVCAHGLLLHLIWELVKGDPCRRPSSQPQGLVAANNILESGRHQEVLLFQSELFPFKHLEEGDERRTGEGRREGKGGGRESIVCLAEWSRVSVFVHASVTQSSHIVVGVQNPGYVLCKVLVQHCLDVVSMVD